MGDIKKRNSRYAAARYYAARDKYRDNEWKDPIWARTNRCKAQYMMGRSKYIEDRAAVLRLSLGKAWANSRHNGDLCRACGGENKSIEHALFRCRHLDVAGVRKQWRHDVDKCVNKTYNKDMKGIVGEIMMKAMNCKGGEFACLGTFREQFVNQLHLGHLMVSGGEERTIWKALKVLGQGARLVMAAFNKANVGVFSCMELRQGTLQEHFKVIKQPKLHRDGAPDHKLAKRDKERAKRSRKPVRKGGIRMEALAPGDVEGVLGGWGGEGIIYSGRVSIVLR